MSPMIPYCDNCGCIAEKNAANESGITSTREGITVVTKVLKSAGATPIICEKCVRLVVQHCEKKKKEER